MGTRRLKFTEVALLLGYATYYSGGNKAYKAKSQSEKAYANIVTICQKGDVTLGEIKNALIYQADSCLSATREKIYTRIAEAIVVEEAKEETPDGP